MTEFEPLEKVPTVQELVRQGLATAHDVAKDGRVTRATIKPEGQRLIYEAQARNAEILRRDPRTRVVLPERLP